MITTKGRDELLFIGAKRRIPYLIAQARYTLGLVEQDPEVAVLLGAGFFEECKNVLGQLEIAATDKELAETESEVSTEAQEDAVQEGKIWRRTFTQRAQAAILGGADVPAEAGVMKARGSNPEKLAEDINRLVALGRKHQQALDPSKVTTELLDKGKDLAAKIGKADQEQEIARLKTFPEKVREMYIQKALLYIGVKRINLLGRSVHPEDGEKASRYNMDILYRKVRRKPVDEPKSTATTTTDTKTDPKTGLKTDPK